MSDTEPLLFRVELGVLRPANAAAEEAAKAVNGQTVRIEIKRTTGNVLRLRWYWVMLRLFLENIEDGAFEGNMTPAVLHRWLKREAGLATKITSSKTGEIIDWDYGSISFHRMPENERSEFVNFAAEKLSARLGVDVNTLKNEAQSGG